MRNAVTRDASLCLFSRIEVSSFLTDHDAQFYFPVGFFASARNLDIVIWPDHRARCFHEKDGLFRNGHARFCGVIRVV